MLSLSMFNAGLQVLDKKQQSLMLTLSELGPWASSCRNSIECSLASLQRHRVQILQQSCSPHGLLGGTSSQEIWNHLHICKKWSNLQLYCFMGKTSGIWFCTWGIAHHLHSFCNLVSKSSEDLSLQLRSLHARMKLVSIIMQNTLKRLPLKSGLKFSWYVLGGTKASQVCRESFFWALESLQIRWRLWSSATVWPTSLLQAVLECSCEEYFP